MMKVLPLAVLTVALVGCNNYNPANKKNYIFDGYIYDGVTNAKVTKYTLTLQYAGQTENATIDKDGRYTVGDLPALQDYTVTVTAAGYRPFISNNKQLSDSTFSAPATVTAPGDVSSPANQNAIDERTFNAEESVGFDAFLFPTATAAPDTTFTIVEDDASTPPSGTLRLTPTGGSSLVNTTAPGNRTWGNTADLQYNTVVIAFTNGTVTVPGKQLVYGVTYNVDVFGVAGYQVAVPAQVPNPTPPPAPATVGQTVAIGSQTNVIVSLTHATTTPLKLIYCNNQDANTVSSNPPTISCFFNQAVIIDPTLSQGAANQLVQVTGINFFNPNGTTTDASALVTTPTYGKVTAGGNNQVDIAGATAADFAAPPTVGDVPYSYTYTIAAGLNVRAVSYNQVDAANLTFDMSGIANKTVIVLQLPQHN